MLTVIVAIAIVWAMIAGLVWAACLAAARGDAEQAARCLPARIPRRAASGTGERLIIWENLPGLPVGDSRLGAQGAR